MNNPKISVNFAKLFEGLVVLIIGLLIFIYVSPQFFMLFSVFLLLKYKLAVTPLIIILKIILIELSFYQVIPEGFGLLYLLLGFITSTLILLFIATTLTILESKKQPAGLILAGLFYFSMSFYYLAQMFFVRYSGDFFSVLVLRNSVYTMNYLDLVFAMITLHDLAFILSVFLMLSLVIKKIALTLNAIPSYRITQKQRVPNTTTCFSRKV